MSALFLFSSDTSFSVLSLPFKIESARERGRDMNEDRVCLFVGGTAHTSVREAFLTTF